MTDAFWTGGREVYAAALQEEHEALLLVLREKCEQCNDQAVRAQLEAEIAAAEAEHRLKLRGISRLLF